MGRRNPPHTSCHRGHWVLVILKDGTRVVGRFHERTDRAIMLRIGLDDRERTIQKSDIRAFTPLGKARAMAHVVAR
jgi:hypothetical protein